jgi:hypothetical protein
MHAVLGEQCLNPKTKQLSIREKKEYVKPLSFETYSLCLHRTPIRLCVLLIHPPRCVRHAWHRRPGFSYFVHLCINGELFLCELNTSWW